MITQFALKFISGKHQDKEFVIEPNSEVKIGRSSDLELVLIEEMVSRRHAVIIHQNNAVWIEDLGSANGTFVNGEKITARQQIKEGDRILIGTAIIRLITRVIEAPAPPPPSRPQRPDPGAAKSHLSGYLEEIPLPDLLQLYGTSKKTGTIIVNTEFDEGRIYLKAGRLISATTHNSPDIPPDKAFYRMMSWTSGTFMCDTSVPDNLPQAIDENVEGMMMEGMRLLDEIKNLGSDLPNMSDHLAVPAPLVLPLRDLSPELLDTLQLVHNYGQVETVLNKSLATDLEMLQDIVYLLKNEYLVIA